MTDRTCTVDTLAAVIARHGGLLSSGAHPCSDDGPICVLEARSECLGLPWTDEPMVVGAPDLRGLNDASLLPLCDYAAQEDLVLRLIEYMPIGVDAFWGPETWLPVAESRARVAEAYELTPDESGEIPGGGPARYWRGRHRQTGQNLRVGFISAVSEKFCEACNRVRLSPTGTLRECLSARGALSLRDLLRSGADEATLAAAIRDALSGKVDGHQYDASIGTLESMSAIGG